MLSILREKRFVRYGLLILLSFILFFMTNTARADVINGIETNTLPYTVSGLEISEIRIGDYDKITLVIKNKTGFPISGSSYINYKCYNAQGQVLKSSCVYTEYLNADEGCVAAFYLAEGTTRIIFEQAGVYLGSESQEHVTSFYNGIEVNTIPYSTSGLRIEKIVFGDYDRVTVTVQNKTGLPISGSSGINYRCYDGNGNVLKTSTLYLEALNADEACVVTFYKATGTKKLLFEGAKVYKGSETSSHEMVQYSNGISINKLPYSHRGLKITNISFGDYDKITLRIENKTGVPVKGTSKISYKCYNSKGNVLKSSSVYVEDLNMDEACITTFYMAKGTKKIVLDEATVNPGEEFSDHITSLISGVRMNTLPYDASGLCISKASIDKYGKVTLTIENKTGMPLKDTSHISYKCYDKNQNVLKSSNVYIEQMNKDETCLATLYTADGTVKILFDKASLTLGTNSIPRRTMKYKGIEVTQIPCNVCGLEIRKITKETNGKVSLTIRNSTGTAIKGTSHITYKCYDKNNNVLKNSSVYTEYLNHNQECISTLWLADGTAKLIFSDFIVYYSNGSSGGTLQCGHQYSTQITCIPAKNNKNGLIGYTYCTVCHEIMSEGTVISANSACTIPGKTVSKESFYNIGAEQITVMDGYEHIEEGAFSNCGNLRLVILPDSVETIDEHAFDGCTDLYICCNPDSPAGDFAKQNNIPIAVILQ